MLNFNRSTRITFILFILKKRKIKYSKLTKVANFLFGFQPDENSKWILLIRNEFYLYPSLCRLFDIQRVAAVYREWKTMSQWKEGTDMYV